MDSLRVVDGCCSLFVDGCRVVVVVGCVLGVICCVCCGVLFVLCCCFFVDCVLMVSCCSLCVVRCVSLVGDGVRCWLFDCVLVIVGRCVVLFVLDCCLLCDCWLFGVC